MLRLARQLGAAPAILQMGTEPFALGLRDAFDALLRYQLLGAGMQVGVHLEISLSRGAACCATTGTIAYAAKAFGFFVMQHLPGALREVLPARGTGATSRWKVERSARQPFLQFAILLGTGGRAPRDKLRDSLQRCLNIFFRLLAEDLAQRRGIRFVH